MSLRSSIAALRALLVVRPPVPVLVPVPVRARALSTTAARQHKETESNNPEYEVEKLKEASLHRQKEEKGEWMAGLASDSEETVKADRTQFNPKDLQRMSTEAGQKPGSSASRQQHEEPGKQQKA